MSKNFNDVEDVVNSIREGLISWDKKRADSRCDKLGVGFNRDSRFSVAKFELSLDNWAGNYGNSSCSTFLYVGKQEIFRPAFISVLNSKMYKLLGWTANLLDVENREARAKRIVEMEKELEELKSKQEGK